MKKLILTNTISILFTLLFIGCNSPNRLNKSYVTIKQPLIEQQIVIEELCDTSIVDYYRNMENLHDTNVNKWFIEQGEYTDQILSQISDRQIMKGLMQKNTSKKKYYVAHVHVTNTNQYFYLKRKSEEPAFKLYFRESLDQKEEMLFDPATCNLSDSNSLVINNFTPDWNGEKILIAISSGGSDVMDLIIYDRLQKNILSERIENVFNVPDEAGYWLPDNQGFLYLKYNDSTAGGRDALLNMQTRYYKIGKDTSETIDVFSHVTCSDCEMKPEDFPLVSINSVNDTYAIGSIAGASYFSDLYYSKISDIDMGNPEWKPLCKSEHKVIKGYFLDATYIFISALNASNRVIARTNIINPDFEHPEIIVQEKDNEVIQDFILTSSGLFYTTIKNGVDAKLYFTDFSEEKEIPLPGNYGRIFLENKSPESPELWVSAIGWLTDMERMKYDLNTDSFTTENLVPPNSYPEFENFVIEELMVQSKDGETIPMSVIYDKSIKKDANNPTLLYGYGAYGVSWSPYFMPDWLTWVEAGGILCFAHIRGGGEKGENWHYDGMYENKPNSWKDFITCGEYLIDKNFTSNKKLIIYGGSAGGIVIGRAMTERPDLFAAVISEVGMLNAARFESMPSGLNHAKEFGYISDSTDCKNLIEMDAYLHIESNKTYPPFLAIVGMNDLRVSPWQSGKFVAKLQNVSKSGNVVLLMVDFNEGHYFNSTTDKSISKLSSVFTFALWQTNSSLSQKR